MKHILNCTGYDEVDINLVRGEKCYLYDDRGKKYIDFESGIWCTALGHNHPEVNHVLKSQLKMITNLSYRYQNKTTEEAARKVLEIVGMKDGKCIFLSSGSEAVEFGVQAARLITGKPLLLTLSDSYLSAYGSAAKKNTNEWYSFNWKECASCPSSGLCDNECKHIKEIPFQDIGGFVLECGSGSGFVKFPPAGIIEKLADLIKTNNGLLVANEITTGMGRTGKWFGYMHYSFQPDIIAMGKGLGNGYPVSAAAMKTEIAEKLIQLDFHHAQSHQNNPLGCAVANEVITIMQKEKLIEKNWETGIFFLDKLNCLMEKYCIVKNVRGRGLILGIEFREYSQAKTIFYKLLEKGIIAGYKPAGNLLRFFPPFIIGIEDINYLISCLEGIIIAES